MSLQQNKTIWEITHRAHGMSTVLIVDDKAIIREPIAAALRASGFDAIGASSGREALELLRRLKPDVMLLDIVMPEMTGLDVLREMQSDSAIPKCPVVVLSGHADRRIVMKAAGLGVHAYILKTNFSLEGLVARLHQAIEGAQEVPQGANISIKPTATKEDKPGDAPKSRGDITAELPEQSTEQLKGLRPLLNRAEINERLDRVGEMKAMSPIVAEVIKLTSSESTSIEQIAKVIKRDHAIALKVLKLANSAVYTRGDTVESVDQAISRIGLGSIRQAVLNMAVVDQFGTDSHFHGIDPLQFWEHCIACGLIGAEIARSRNEKEPDLAFTMGLLHDVGRLVYIEQFPDLYDQVFQTATRLQLPLERVESKMLLLNHADCMDRILHLWRFPKNLIDPIVFHHLSIGNMRRMASKRVEEVATLGLADRLSHALLLGYSGNEVIYPTEGLCQHLRLQGSVVRRLEETIREQTNEIKLTMMTNTGGAQWTDRRVLWQNKLEEPLRPLFVSSSPEFDSYRIFCDQLRDRAEESPNIIILHIADARELGELASRARDAESDAGASHLPLVTLSPKGDLVPPPSVTEGRVCYQLPTPVTVARLVSTLNAALTKRSVVAAAA